MTVFLVLQLLLLVTTTQPASSWIIKTSSSLLPSKSSVGITQQSLQHFINNNMDTRSYGGHGHGGGSGGRCRSGCCNEMKRYHRQGIIQFSTKSSNSNSRGSSAGGGTAHNNPDDDIDDNDDNWWNVDDLEVLQKGYGDDFFENEQEEESWIPDGEMARRRRNQPKTANANAGAASPTSAASAASAVSAMANEVQQNQSTKKQKQQQKQKSSTNPSPYTEEEQDLIDAMGGKGPPQKRSSSSDGDSNTSSSTSATTTTKREDGFLGDCTLQEIATDYSVPVCYLADVLCLWGVPVPINIHDRLGDLITGEQAFALVEAVYSLDIGALQDRYSNQSLQVVCDEWDISMIDAFQFAIEQEWSLPFGVQTNLRIEQEEELIRVFSSY